jgi:hypothetical protein
MVIWLGMASFQLSYHSSLQKASSCLRAADYLDSVQINEETETMWKTLARVALESRQFSIAER